MTFCSQICGRCYGVPMPDTPRIVTNRAKPRKRVVKKPVQPELAQRIVAHPTKYERARKVAELSPDPEADASVAAFFARAIRPKGGVG